MARRGSEGENRSPSVSYWQQHGGPSDLRCGEHEAMEEEVHRLEEVLVLLAVQLPRTILQQYVRVDDRTLFERVRLPPVQEAIE